MPRIAHTADIHIRALSRHDEYRETFKEFTEDCKKQSVDHIFVGGDIFHTKTTGISPEYIDLLTWWLNDMSKVAPVHLILGNHDGNLVNLSRQDAVSPIVEAMANPRVHLYKDSGIYQLQPGFNLCVYSVFDEPGWSRVSPVPDEVNIAAYHGPVWGSKTESDWTVEDGLRVDFFDSYPFTFLGDIHKRQDLTFRDGKPIMSYPGTLIQQNYAEELDHGYLLWDIKNISEWSVEFRKLANKRPFVTLGWMGSVDAAVTAAIGYPSQSRFRIKSQVNVSLDDMHRLSEILKSSGASEVTYKSEQQIDKQVVAAGVSKLVKSDLRSPDVLMNLLKDFHENKINDSDVETLTTQIKSYLSTVSNGEEISRGSKWSLRHLKWDNMFVYGEDNSIDFDKLRGIVGIFGANRTGKSSIVGTLMYSLFNTTDRGPMKNIYVCNVRKPYCFSQAILTHNGTSYVVERQTTKTTNKKGVVNASTTLNVFRVTDAGELQDIKGEQRTDTEKTIRSLIGAPEDFLMTTLSAQGDPNQFIAQGSTKRRAILSRFLDLDVFDKLYDMSNKDLNGLKAQLRNFPDRNWEEAEQMNEDAFKSLEQLLIDLNDQITSNHSKLALLRTDLMSHKASLVSAEDVENQRKLLTTIQSKSDDCRDRVQIRQKEVDDLQEKIKVLEDIVSNTDVSSLKLKLESQRKLEKSILELKHAYEKEDSSLAQQKRSLKILDEVPCGDDYPTCRFIKDAYAVKSKLTAQESRVDKAKKSLDDAEKAFVVVKDDSVEEKILKHSKALDLMNKISIEMSRKETEIERIKSTCSDCDKSLEDAKKKLILLEEAVNNEEAEEVVRVRKEIDDLTQSSKDLDRQRTDVLDRRGKLSAKIEHLAEEKKNRDVILNQMRLQELLAVAFSKKGIPASVTRSQLPLINAEISKILQGIVDFTVELENEEDTDSLEVYINYGDSRRIIELCSGMEKTVTSIALRVALANVSSLPKPDLFIVDEGFGTLDNAGVESCNRLLTSLKRYFRTIIVITHVDGIKDSADHIIEITKREKDSYVEFK